MRQTATQKRSTMVSTFAFPPLTKDQAMTANYLHTNSSCYDTWRRNGKTQTWVTRPCDFRLPLKHGMYSYDAITHNWAHLVHVAGCEGCVNP